MTAFKVTGANSLFSSNFVAFNQDSPAADSLTVDVDAFVISTGNDTDDHAVVLAGTKAWTATINGTVLATEGNGIALSSLIDGQSKITIGASGSVTGGSNGIAAGENLAITNNGKIFGSNQGLVLGGKVNTLTNTGLIDGGNSVGVLLGGGNSGGATTRITNTATGRIDGINDVSQGVAVTITNSGVITSNILLLGDVAQTISNSGQIGGIIVGDGKNTITNSSAGFIGSVEVREGTNTINNSGTINAVNFDVNGIDIVTNSGKLGGGLLDVIDFGGGNDVFRNTSLHEISFNLGDGADKFTGGNGREHLTAGTGNDTYNLGGGNDEYIIGVGDGIDTIDGGAGTGDMYNATFSAVSAHINLDTISHSFERFIPGSILLPGRALTTNTDFIKNFEHAIGGNFDDRIAGNASANSLLGRDGNDVLLGNGGNDELGGGNGSDRLIGGAGKDRLIGGAGGDVFIFEKASDSTHAARDIIDSFDDGIDVIELGFMDANTKNGSATNDTFDYIGSHVSFSGVAGQLRSYFTQTGWIFEGDTNGDAKADFAFEVNNDPNHLLTWSAVHNLHL